VIEWGFLPNDDGKITITHREADGLTVLIEWVRNGITSASEIADEMGLSKGQVSKMATRAIQLGKLKKVGRDYALPDDQVADVVGDIPYEPEDRFPFLQ
jgi:hypothetical protein